jgi:hypothetical protein
VPMSTSPPAVYGSASVMPESLKISSRN